MDLIGAISGAQTLSVLLNTPVFSGKFAGDGSELTGINGSNYVNKIGDTMTGARLRDETTAWHGRQKAENAQLKATLDQILQRLRALEGARAGAVE